MSKELAVEEERIEGFQRFTGFPSAARGEEELDLWITPQAGDTPRSERPIHRTHSRYHRKDFYNFPTRWRKEREERFQRFTGFPSAARGDNKVRDKLDLWITPQAGDTPRSGKKKKEASPHGWPPCVALDLQRALPRRIS